MSERVPIGSSPQAGGLKGSFIPLRTYRVAIAVSRGLVTSTKTAMPLFRSALRHFASVCIALTVHTHTVVAASDTGKLAWKTVENAAVFETADPASQQVVLQSLRLGPDEGSADVPVINQSLFEYNEPAGVHRCGEDKAYDWHLMPQGLIYQPYLASAKESRFRAIWNDESGEDAIWDVTLGGQVGLLRYGTRGDQQPLGFQLGIEGAGLVRLDLDENNDVMSADYRFGIPLTWGNESYQVKVGYYHLSSHLGDEFLLKNPGFPRLNFSRDVLVWGTSLTPIDLWRVYTEIGYAVASDVSQQWEFQFGVDYSPDGPTGARGAPFAAVNGHLREEVDFGGNFVFQTGWAWRRAPSSGMFRMGIEYYNGKSDQFSFFDESEQKVGFGLWYDH